jgi:hypothetical protein
MILSLDPGHWTGWALVGVEGEFARVFAVGQFRYEELPHHISALQLLSRAFQVRQWVVEDIPDTQPDATTKEIIDFILGAAIDLGVRVERIKPFHWKYLKSQVQVPDLIHSRDAAGMGMVWLDRLSTSL